MADNRVIASCKIGPYPTSIWGPLPEVVVTLDDGATKNLFHFYPDELSFQDSEFVGLTVGQAMQLRHDKDVAYLRS